MSDFNIDHVARLARIELTAEEKDRFAAQLGDVLAYIGQLEQVDVSAVEAAAHAHPVFNVWGEDEPGPTLPPEAALKNAPASREGMFLVPKVVE